MKTFDELYDAQGNYITDERYTEIIRLHDMLKAAGIKHEFKKFMDGWQVIYPEDGPERVMDAVEHFCSYGNEDDLLEIMGLLTTEEEKHDTVLGNLTAEDVFTRIQEHWRNEQ